MNNAVSQHFFCILLQKKSLHTYNTNYFAIFTYSTVMFTFTHMRFWLLPMTFSDFVEFSGLDAGPRNLNSKFSTSTGLPEYVWAAVRTHHLLNTAKRYTTSCNNALSKTVLFKMILGFFLYIFVWSVLQQIPVEGNYRGIFPLSLLISSYWKNYLLETRLFVPFWLRCKPKDLDRYCLSEFLQRYRLICNFCTKRF